MIDLSNKVWDKLIGAYGKPYSPVLAIKKIENREFKAISELWENLFHQGDVNTSSYAAIPHLLRLFKLTGNIELLNLLLTILIASKYEKNPEIPTDLEEDIFVVIDEARNVSLDALKTGADDSELRIHLSTISFSSNVSLSEAILNLDKDIISEIIADYSPR